MLFFGYFVIFCNKLRNMQLNSCGPNLLETIYRSTYLLLLRSTIGFASIAFPHYTYYGQSINDRYEVRPEHMADHENKPTSASRWIKVPYNSRAVPKVSVKAGSMHPMRDVSS